MSPAAATSMPCSAGPLKHLRLLPSPVLGRLLSGMSHSMSVPPMASLQCCRLTGARRRWLCLLGTNGYSGRAELATSKKGPDRCRLALPPSAAFSLCGVKKRSCNTCSHESLVLAIQQQFNIRSKSTTCVLQDSSRSAQLVIISVRAQRSNPRGSVRG